MSKTIKDMITRDLATRYSSAEAALWLEFIGVDGVTTTEFRKSLRAKKMKMQIVKTSLFRRAVAGKPLDRLGQAASGPVALISGGESLVDVAKAVEEWLPKLKTVKLRAAVMEGEFIGASQISGLSKMPTKRDMQGRIASAIRSPGANLAAAIRAPGSNIAGCLKSLIEKLEKSGSTEAAPAA
jgi:large subunit ribosomal protein L10